MKKSQLGQPSAPMEPADRRLMATDRAERDTRSFFLIFEGQGAHSSIGEENKRHRRPMMISSALRGRAPGAGPPVN